MSNFIESANIPTSKFASALSRYNNSTVVYYHIGTIKKLTYTTYKKQIPTTASDSDMYMVIPAGMEYRPDLVSQNVYNTPDFWWKIMEANSIKDIFDFKVGTNLRIPHNVF